MWNVECLTLLDLNLLDQGGLVSPRTHEARLAAANYHRAFLSLLILLIRRSSGAEVVGRCMLLSLVGGFMTWKAWLTTIVA